jgi:uncharacterized protein (TIGR03083 family)
MKLTPRYDAPALMELEGPADDVLEPLVRQRRRLVDLLAGLDESQWAMSSRCQGWTVGHVVAHLVSTNQFWEHSVVAGLRGEPTTMLAAFDPATTPPLLIADLVKLATAELLDRLRTSGDAFLDVVAGLDEAGWRTAAESPPGHVPIRLLCFHALWDCWVHERDIALPLGLTPTTEADEVDRCLRYVAALSPAFAVVQGRAPRSVLAIEATDPGIDLVLDVADPVVVRSGPAPAGAARLRGDAVELVEALSVRVPLPASAPALWSQLHHDGVAAVFDAAEIRG